MEEALDLMAVTEDIRNERTGCYLRQSDRTQYDNLLGKVPEICLDGSKCTDFNEFCKEVARAWKWDVKDSGDDVLWNRADTDTLWRSKALEDFQNLLFGDVGSIQPPYSLVIFDASVAREHLGHADRLDTLKAEALAMLKTKQQEFNEFKDWLVEIQFKEGDDADWDVPCETELRRGESAVAAAELVCANCAESEETTFGVIIEMIQQQCHIDRGVMLTIHDGARITPAHLPDLSFLSESRRDSFVARQLHDYDQAGYLRVVREAFLPMPELVIDGSKCTSKEAFYDQVEVAWCMGEQSWGRNLDALSDIICGGFGVPKKEPPHIIVLREAHKARNSLGAELFDTFVDVLSCRKRQGAFFRLEEA